LTEIARVFLSVDIEDQSLLSRIREIQGLLNHEAAKMKLVEEENIHFTWRFFGDTSLNTVDQIRVELEKLDFDSFSIDISGVSAFPRINRPRVIWIGVANNADLMVKLKKETDNLISVLGFKPEKKKFIPHATIARVRVVRNRDSMIQNLESIADESVGTMNIDSISMTKSTLTPSGPIYKTLWQIQLL
jgi:2'-5' RNA ligase